MSTTDSSSSRTTTTTSTSWERVRKNGGWLPVAAGAAGLAVLGLVNGLPMRDSVEKDLTARSQQALATLGGSGLTVDFTGRDGVIKGTLPDGVSKDQVLQAVADVNGVRVVTFIPSEAANGASPSPSPTALPSSESPSAAALALPAVQSVATDGAVVLTGRVPTQAAADALVAAAAAVYGADKVTNQLSVDAGVSDAGLTGFAALFGAFGKDAAATASLADGTLTLSGAVASADVQKAVDTAAAAVTGDTAKVVDQLTLAGPAPSPSPSPAATSGSAGGAAVQAKLNALPLVLFPSASNSLTPQAQAIIKQAAEILKASPDVKVRLDGHTDDLGSSRVNNELSAARAMTVRSYLIQLGVSADRLTYGYHGYADPKVANRNDAARAQNRRVTFTVL